MRPARFSTSRPPRCQRRRPSSPGVLSSSLTGQSPAEGLMVCKPGWLGDASAKSTNLVWAEGFAPSPPPWQSGILAHIRCPRFDSLSASDRRRHKTVQFSRAVFPPWIGGLRFRKAVCKPMVSGHGLVAAPAGRSARAIRRGHGFRAWICTRNKRYQNRCSAIELRSL